MGPFIIIVGIGLMIIIHEGGHFIAAKAFGMKATEAFFGFGPTLWSINRGETEYGIKAIPLGGYVRIIGMNPLEEIPPEDEGRTYRSAPYWQKTIVVLAGIASHFIVALFLLWFVGVAWGTLVFDNDGILVRNTTIAAVAPTVPESGAASPASLSGIAEGDIIVATNGVGVATWEDFSTFAQENGGNDVVITVGREGSEIDLDTTLATIDRPVIANGDVVTDDAGEVVTEEAGYFGVTPEAVREKQGVFAMIPIAFGQFGEAIVQSFRGLWEMLIGFPKLIASLFGGDDEILETVRPISPIGLVRIAGPAESALQLLAVVNIFVGVLNFIPLYPLDGGHFAVATYAKIAGHEPDVRKMMPVAAAVVMFLISLGLVGLYLDIFKPIG